MYAHQVFFESIAVDGTIAQFVSVSVNCVDRIVKNMRNMSTVLDTHTHESQDTKVGVQLLAVLKFYTLVREQQFIYLIDKIRI